MAQTQIFTSPVDQTHVLMLSWDREDVVLVQVIGMYGTVEASGRTSFGALSDLCQSLVWALVAGDISLVHDGGQRFQARVMQRQIMIDVGLDEFRRALSDLGTAFGESAECQLAEKRA